MKPATQLANLGDEGFATLLRERLSALECEDRRLRLSALDIFDRVVMQWQPPVDLLALFYRGLIPSAQTSFRKAIGRVLKQVKPGMLSDEAIVTLVLLAGSVQAYESVEAIVDCADGRAQWIQRKPSLMVHVLAVLKGMRSSQEANIQCHRLVCGESFPFWLVFDAYEILLAGKPADWASNWVALLPLFERAQREGPPQASRSPGQWFDMRMREMVGRCFSQVSAFDIACGLGRMSELLRDDLTDYLDKERSIGALLLALFAEHGSPFERSADGQWCVKRGNADGVREEWPVDTAAINFLLHMHESIAKTLALKLTNSQLEADLNSQLEAERNYLLGVDALSVKIPAQKETKSTITTNPSLDKINIIRMLENSSMDIALTAA